MNTLQEFIKKLEKKTGKKVIFQEDYDSASSDIQKVIQKMAISLIESIKEKSKFYARKHNIRQDAIETMMKNDLIKYINSKLS